MIANKGCLRGCSATRPEAADLGRTLPVHAKGLAKIRGFGEALDRQTESFPGNRTMQTRLLGGFCDSGFWCRGLAEMEPCAQRIPRAPRACPIMASLSTRQAMRLC